LIAHVTIGLPAHDSLRNESDYDFKLVPGLRGKTGTTIKSSADRHIRGNSSDRSQWSQSRYRAFYYSEVGWSLLVKRQRVFLEHLSRNGEKTGCPFTEGACWTLLVERQCVSLEHTKLLFLSDTLAICILFSLLFSSPYFSDTVLDLQSPVPEW
jgi:hypothetical protein